MVSENDVDIKQLKSDLSLALEDLLSAADLDREDVMVIGCSTSEIIGKKIGKASNLELAEELFSVIENKLRAEEIYPAFQCCEHLNRALVVPGELFANSDLEEVTAIPAPDAGGAMGAAAYEKLNEAVVVESVRADAGLDIGDTLIGMHLKEVAVPVRGRVIKLGEAHITMARTRPRLIGGQRARYPS